MHIGPDLNRHGMMTQVGKDAGTTVLGRHVTFGCNGHKVTEEDAIRLDMADRGTGGPAHSNTLSHKGVIRLDTCHSKRYELPGI